MELTAPIPASERAFLRDLAQRQLELAHLPAMAERERLWRLHNGLKGERPMVVLDDDVLDDLMPEPTCAHPLALEMERRMHRIVSSQEWLDDDKVVPAYYPVYFEIEGDILGLGTDMAPADTGPGFHINSVLETLADGLGRLHPTDYRYDAGLTAFKEEVAEDIFGDILPTRRQNLYNAWHFVPTNHLVKAMGMENMYLAMAAEPDDFHRLMRLMTDDLKACLEFEQANGLLLLNNANDYTGSGNICFTDDLPGAGFDGVVRPEHLWAHTDCQEAIGISPDYYHEFVYPYLAEICSWFGLIYYACCEPVHEIWDQSVQHLPNLRKVSVSPWCDEAFMAERLADLPIVYSRHPSPNYLGITPDLDEAAWADHLQATADVTRAAGCRVEFIIRDVYSLHGNKEKARRAIEIMRRVSETIYP
jgi:hypothetical protein